MLLRLRPEARDDLYAAARWYEAKEIGLGGHFLAEVHYQKSILQTFGMSTSCISL
jgi:hypothetical protein